MILETPNRPRLVSIVIQQLRFELREISGPNAKCLGSSGLDKGGYWLRHFWNWGDQTGLGNS